MRAAFAVVAVAAQRVQRRTAAGDGGWIFEVASIKPATFPNEPYFEGYALRCRSVRHLEPPAPN